jgi:hypothetical protein
VQCCRLRECGTPKAWKRLKGCQSFTDGPSCLASLKWHLVNSIHHYADPAEVDLLFETLDPEMEELPKFWFDNVTPEPMPPADAPPLHVLAKRRKVAEASGNQGGGASSSSASGGLGSVSVQADRTELTDTITLRRSTLLTMLDCVERAAAAAKHAISISTVARDTFQTEEQRLSDCARQLARICER